jgi:hypothetical protein
LHPALDELGWNGLADEFDEAARLKDQSVPETILITTNRMILSGFGSWRLALLVGRNEVHCIEYSLNDE